MHRLRQLIREINRTHKRLGPMIAVNILAAKAKKTILNIAPAGCGKSTASDAVHHILGDRSVKYTSLTLAGLKHLQDKLRNFDGHIVIDDLGAEKSLWSRTATITVLANLVYSHYVYKITQGYTINIEGFDGSVSLNVQPVLMNTLVQGDDWVAVTRDKVLRYYHLYRPIDPQQHGIHKKIDWGPNLTDVKMSGHKGKLWYQLVAITLTQWSWARVNEHLPDMLRAAAALDGRRKVNVTDYNLLIKLLKPMQLERYLIKSYGFEAGRVFDNNLYCILVELASFGSPTLLQICEDYKINPKNAEELILQVAEWCRIQGNSNKRVVATGDAEDILDICGVNEKW